MKKLSILIFLLFAGNIYSQVYWEELTPLRDVEYTMDVFFPTTTRGYLAGKQSGTILRTDNSGSSWTKLRLPLTTSSNFHEIQFINKDTGFFVGTSSYMTVNGCNTYTSFPASISNMQSVWFTSATTGFMAGSGGKIYKTTNMGGTWNLLTSGTTTQLNSIHFANVDTGMAVGNNGLAVRTVDGGNTWNTISMPTTNFLESIQFINDSTAYIAADFASIYVSTDAGATWTLVPTSFSGNSFTLYRLRFFNSLFGYAVGTNNKIAFTSDAGQTWTLSSIPGYLSDFYSVGFRPDGTVFLGGVGKVWQSSDYTNWTTNMAGVAKSTLNDVEFIDADTGFVCGYGGQNGDTYQTIIRTSNRGRLWSAKATGNDFTSSGFHSLAFTTPYDGIAGANSTTSVHTTNCGTTWPSMSGFNGISAPNDMQYLGGSTVYACGGGVQVTTNGGTTWTNTIIPGAPNLTALSFVNTNLGYVCGLNGKVYKTTNACAAWTNLIPGTSGNFSTISFPTDSIGYVIGPTTSFFKTIDGGTTWNTLVGGANTVKLIFVDKDSGYVIGQYGGLLKTINGGTSLNTIISGINNVLIKGATLNNNSIYAVGQAGTVLRHVLGCTGPPQLTNTITGVNNTCVFNTDTFTLPVITGATYQWEDLYGAQLVQVNPYQVTVHWLIPGTFYVKANLSNECGTSETVNLKVTVHALPVVPLITQSGNTLICNYTSGVQWYLNGTLIPGETNDSLQATQNGTYSVAYTDSLNCGSASTGFSFTFTGIETYGSPVRVIVFPNPTSKSVTVSANASIKRICIYDLSGRKIVDHLAAPGSKSLELSPDISAGSYFMIVETAEAIRTLRFLKTAE